MIHVIAALCSNKTKKGVAPNTPDCTRANERTRTAGLLITSELLYHLSYVGNEATTILTYFVLFSSCLTCAFFHYIVRILGT